MSNRADVIVIGSGPGGEGAAMQLAKGGKSVVVIERHAQIGGGCTHWGTIPSKALRTAILQLMESCQNPLVRSHVRGLRYSMADLTRSAQSVIAAQVALRQNFYDRNEVRIVTGHARLSGPGRVVVEGETWQAEAVVLATGSRPWRPPNVDFDHPRIFDSDTILSLRDRPHSLTICGAGVVGCEYASMFRNLDVKVNLVNSRDRLLDFLDDEISDALSYHLRERGVVIRHQESVRAVTGYADGVVVELDSGKQIKSDVLLWANGRTGNSDGLGLETIGLQPDSRGYIAVDEFGRTAAEGVYAVGDLVGFPSLASAAYTQGRAAARQILGVSDAAPALSLIPTGIYTSPEISSIGSTERQLTAAKTPYEVGIAHFRSIARAQITGQTAGMLKLLFHRETLQVLGIHCFGSNATEIIHIGQAVMAGPAEGNSLRYFMDTTFNYPTMAEAYRVAALNGFNRLF